MTPPNPAVGDTIRAVRVLPGPPGTRPRPGSLAATDRLEPLGEPQVVIRGDRVLIGYAFGLFEPGEHAVPMPSVELLYPDGRAETVVGDTARVRVRSVLPAGDTLAAPQPSLGPVPRAARSPGALLVLIGAVLTGAAVWGVRRRRVAGRPAPPGVASAAVEPPLERWVGAGEVRAAAATTAVRLRRVLASREPSAHTGLSVEECLAALRRSRPQWPLDDLEDTLRLLERAQFAPAVPADVLALADQVTILVERIG